MTRFSTWWTALVIAVTASHAGGQDDTAASPPRGWGGIWKVTAHEVTDPRNEVHPEETFYGVVCMQGTKVVVYGRISTWGIGVDKFVASGATLSASVEANWTNPDMPQVVRDDLNSRKLPHRVELTMSGDGNSAEGFDSGPWARWSREDNTVLEAYTFDRPLSLQRVEARIAFVRVNSDGASRVVQRMGVDEPFHLELRTSEEVTLPSEPPFGANIPLALGMDGGTGAFNMFRPAGAGSPEGGGGFVYRSPPIRFREAAGDASPRIGGNASGLTVQLRPGSRIYGSYGPPFADTSGRLPVFSASDERVAVVFDPRPRLQFLLVSASGLRPVQKIALGLPMVVEVCLDAAIEAPACEVVCKAGDQALRLVAYRTEDPLLYRTRAFIARVASSEGLDPPLEGELRVPGRDDDSADEEPDDT